jgi:nucleotide-binding universal stress UspA family protein
MIHINRILCPVDFSEHSRHALDWAAAFGRWYGAAVSVLHVHRVAVPSLTASPVASPEPFLPTLLSDDERTNIRHAAEAFVAEVREGLALDVIVEEDVNIAGAIVGAARTIPADLIAIGTHGRTGFDRVVLGSVAEKVLRTAACPVLTVPPRAANAPPLAASGVTRVICATDFSESSSRALSYAASLAQRAGTPLTVVHILELVPDAADVLVPESDAFRAARFEDAKRSMAAAIPAAVRNACTVDEMLLAGKPWREIVRLAAERQAGLIVMGAHGRGVIDRMFFGSTTQQVVRQAPCPVLTVR